MPTDAAPVATAAPQLPTGVTQEDLTIPEELLGSLAPSLREGLTAAAPAPAGADDSDDSSASDEQLDDEDSSSTGTGEEDEGEGDAAGDDDDPEVTQHVLQIVQNPASITSVPRALQAKVLERALVDIARVTVDQVALAERQAEQRGYERAQVEAKVGLAEQLLEEGDAAGFREYCEKTFGSVKNFYRLQAGVQPEPTGAANQYQQEAGEVLKQLEGRPDLIARIRENWNYPATPEGIRKLTMDVGALLAGGRNGKPASTSASASELERRRAAAAERATRPRPPGSSGTGGPAPVTLDYLKNPANTAEIHKRMLEEPGFEEAMNRALAH